MCLKVIVVTTNQRQYFEVKLVIMIIQTMKWFVKVAGLVIRIDQAIQIVKVITKQQEYQIKQAMDFMQTKFLEVSIH